MLFLYHKDDEPELTYHGGQGPIVHLEAELHEAVAWAEANNRRWAFTTSNAGANYFNDYANLADLTEVDWDAVQARWWSGGGIEPSVKEHKQAEFLIEESIPWELVKRVGVQSPVMRDTVLATLGTTTHLPPVELRLEWYY